ncbi:hypothetical protein BOTBODRAFT_52645 [Botryobasidium botryosum FD-172 SS1]|uniref:Zn(2)-C6 fungal-type domain-containing protein n=1 Tax=Botryobasidium botryosum (strain FD-172 SS1) TaxID=930990 RepID=A0A067MSJ4_BOTB1|nr:hypothetical protein BOTBODRAFT_52645 [Botryobasidium botryosum FD-172 SS1]
MAPTSTDDISPPDTHPTRSAPPSVSRVRRRPRLPNPCHNCVNREIECDEERPACGPCSRSTHTFSGSGCSYRDPPARTRNQMLQQRIRTLEDEIARLEHQNMQHSASSVERWLSEVESSEDGTSPVNGDSLDPTGHQSSSRTPPPSGPRSPTPPRSIYPHTSGSPNARSPGLQPTPTSGAVYPRPAGRDDDTSSAALEKR